MGLDIRSLLDWAVDIITVAAIPGAAVAWLVTRRESKAKMMTALSQVDKMSSNELPHIQSATAETSQKLDAQTAILERHTDILTSIDRNIAVLVDR